MKRRRARALTLALAFATALPVAAAVPHAPLVTKVDHFFVVSGEAERLFGFFRDELQLPVFWPFTRYGEFASGGLSVGNAILELVLEGSDGASQRTRFQGVAFEPVGDVEAAIAELDRRGIRHGEPDPYTYTQDGQERVGWVNVDLPELPPAGASLFICDYKERQSVRAGQSRASAELAGRGGGPLGVTSVVEIVLGVASPAEASAQWAKLADAPVEAGTTLFSFGAGPRIRLVAAEPEGIQRVVLGVGSVELARRFLTEKGLLGPTAGNELTLAPADLGGLVVSVVED